MQPISFSSILRRLLHRGKRQQAVVTCKHKFAVGRQAERFENRLNLNAQHEAHFAIKVTRKEETLLSWEGCHRSGNVIYFYIH